jgi:hypothetical protein
MSEELETQLQTARDDALASLSEVIEQSRYKSLGDGRIRDPERERIRIRYLRVIISAQAERRKLLADKEIEELKERLERIEEQQSGGVTV